MKNVFVDGYNVINSWNELREIKSHSYESARQKLLESLQNYAAYNCCKVYVVFDAHLVSGSIEKNSVRILWLYLQKKVKRQTALLKRQLI